MRYLRCQGFDAGLGETIDCPRILAHYGALDADRLRTGSRALLCRSKEDWERFDELFDLLQGRAVHPADLPGSFDHFAIDLGQL